MDTLHQIEIGFQVYVVEGGEMFGAVRGYVPEGNALIVYVENAGEIRGAPERGAECARWEGGVGRRVA